MAERVGFAEDHKYLRFFCRRCRKIMEDAVQLQCGCRMCEKCAELEIGNTGAEVFHCRNCGKSVQADDEHKFYYSDTRIRKEIKGTGINSSGVTQATVSNESPQEFSTVFDELLDLHHELPSDRDKQQKEEDKKPFTRMCLTHEHQASRDHEFKIKTKAGTSRSNESFREMISESMQNHKRKKSDTETLPSTRTFAPGGVHKGATNASPFVQPSLVPCGECCSQIRVDTIREHRTRCWKLHLYNGTSFQVHQESSLEASIRNHTATISQHNAVISERTLRMTPDNLLDDFADRILQQFHDTTTTLSQHIRKFKEDQSKWIRTYMQQKLRIDTPINDPIYQTMRWKVEHFSKRIQEEHSLLSREFLSSPDGYNLRLRIDFYNGGHFWLHVVLVQGDNDSQLTWPFQPRVTVSILGEAALDVSEILGARSVSCCSSETQGHVLCSLPSPNRLPHFLIDDCLFIRCSVTS